MSRFSLLASGFFLAIFSLLLLIDEVEAADLEPINFTMAPDYPVNGEAIEISFEVINNDVDPASNVDIIVWNSTSECDTGDGCMPIFETTVSVIDQNKKAEIEFTCEPQGEGGCGGIGERVITIFVDYNDEITETDEDNNKIVHDFEIYSRTKPNLRGMDGDFSIVLDNGNPSKGDAVDVLALFQNTGREKTNGNFFIHFREVFEGSTTTTIELVEIRFELPQAEATQQNVTWTPSQVGNYTIEVLLDSDDDQDEFEEGDNLITMDVFVREHTPELTLDVFRNITVNPEDHWLEEIYSNHSVNLTIHILNQDYAMVGENVKVSFYDLPEGGVENLIGVYTIEEIINGTRVDNDEITPGTAPAYVTWDSGTGTSILGNHSIIIRIDPDDEIEELNEEDNVFSFELKVLESKADLTITDIYVVGEPVRGIPSDVVITVYNKGSADTVSVNVEFRVEGNFIESWNVSLNEGQFTNVTGQYTWNEQQPSIAGYADAPGDVDELQETNNAKSKLVDVVAPEYDLSLISVKPVDPVFKGEFVSFEVQIRNNLAKIPEFKMSVYIDNSSSPEFQTYNFEGDPVYYLHQRDLLYGEVRFVNLFWKTTSKPGLFNISIKAEIDNSDFEDLNLSDNVINTTAKIKAKNYQLSVEMINLPDIIYFNETLQITVSAFNFGPEICCECPPNLDNMTNATDLCTGGAEIALYIDGVLLDDYPDHIYLTKPLARAVGEEVHMFYWKPPKIGTYEIEVRIDPDNIIDEYDELDNIAFDEVTVVVDDRVVVEPDVKEDDSSLIDQPLLWVPLIVLSLGGLGMFAYSRLGDGGDYFDDYGDSDDVQSSGVQKQQSGFRYNPETGETIDLKTGEIIGKDGKK